MTNTADINGVTISYSDIGSGTPLLCLHGGMGVDSQTLHVPAILNLSEHGIRVIIPDQRGHGKSSRDNGAGYTHETWAADVRSLARHLGLSRFALLGHSYGGFLALEYASDFGRHFGGSSFSAKRHVRYGRGVARILSRVMAAIFYRRE